MCTPLCRKPELVYFSKGEGWGIHRVWILKHASLQVFDSLRYGHYHCSGGVRRLWKQLDTSVSREEKEMLGFHTPRNSWLDYGEVHNLCYLPWLWIGYWKHWMWLFDKKDWVYCIILMKERVVGIPLEYYGGECTGKEVWWKMRYWISPFAKDKIVRNVFCSVDIIGMRDVLMVPSVPMGNPTSF